ncbi:MAG TPA: serine/threonine-protein kinase [Gemmatimonadaceae bacterium]|nr:serine/threonine-protein kinase [Gemmatimonadaceae bacterium]
MPERHVVNPLPPSTPAELRAARGQARAIPPDLLREASLRLGVMSLLGAVLWIVGTLLGHLSVRAVSPPGDRRWLSLEPSDAVAAVSAAASLALFAYTRRTKRDPRFVLDVGLGYLLLTTLALAMMTHVTVLFSRVGVAAPPIRPEISWAGVVVLIFAAIVPTPPRKMLVAGLLAVTMNPVSMLIALARGVWLFGSASDALLMHYQDYLLVGVAVVISHVVTQLGRQVTKAREMGSYRVGELLGRGGMGEIYLATHRMLARPAAIKLIRPEMLGGGVGEPAELAVRRFTREAEAAANLRSPHTVEVYDFGVTEEHTLYYVMELLDGMDLETLVRQYGPVPASRAIHILRQVCESLEEAHVRGLVHRDIKPANIHVGIVGLRHDFVKVLDFGLVKTTVTPTMPAAHDEHSLATAAGLTPGTPAYMAPEMVLGETVDGRADLYALGCVAYYMLTARLVFEAETPFQVIVRHLENEPEPPSRRTNRVIPPALDRVVLDCLAKSPADRPQTAADLDRALAAIAIEPWDEAQAARWWAMSRPLAAAVSAGGESPVRNPS